MRVLSALVLAVFMAGPALRAECLLLCLESGQSAPRSTCHSEPADTDGPAIDAHHDCSTIAPAVVTAIKRAATDSAVSLATVAPSSRVVLDRALIDRLLSDPPRFAAPPATRLVPLRI